MPRRRATHLDGGRGCRVRPHRPGTGMGSLPGLDRGRSWPQVTRASTSVIRSRPRRGDCSSAAALPSRSLAIRSRDGAAHLFTCSSGNSTFEEQGPWLGDAGRQLIVGTLFDISSRKEIEQQLLRMVITDPFASRLREHVRATDMAARIGGRNSLCCWKRHR